MARMTIAQQRAREVQFLAEYKTPAPTEADIQEARRNMNSLYRLIGLSENNALLANRESTCNLKSTADSEEREMRWMKRLKNTFQETYGLKLMWPGIYPVILTEEGHHAISIITYD